MRLKQYFQIFMVVLFLFTYQEITIHSKQHFAEEVLECHLCDIAGHADRQHQERSHLVVTEHIAVKVNHVEEKKVVKCVYDLTQKPLQRMVDLSGLVTVGVDRPFLGYLSTAPPYIFS